MKKLAITTLLGILLFVNSCVPTTNTNTTFVTLPNRGCERESSLASTESAAETEIIFINQTANDVKTYWSDYGGKRVFYQTVPAGGQVIQPTYLTHPWIVKDANDKCIATFDPVNESAQAIVK